MNWANSLQADTNSERLKMPWIIIGWVWSKMCVGYLGNGILKSALSQEWIDELSWFFACWYKFRKPKSYFNVHFVGMTKYGHGLLGHGTLKFVVFQWIIDALSWFFVCGSDVITFG